MKRIPLTQGKEALVDDEDFEWLSQWKWCAAKDKKTFYAKRRAKGQTILMHRELIGAKPGEQVDHRDGNGLNNQDTNTRICTHRENNLNRRPNNNTSGFKGVSWCKGRKKWVSQIKVLGYAFTLGRFLTREEAARAYDSAVRKYFGEFAHLNFP